jgi:hypothetical protein
VNEPPNKPESSKSEPNNYLSRIPGHVAIWWQKNPNTLQYLSWFLLFSAWNIQNYSSEYSIYYWGGITKIRQLNYFTRSVSAYRDPYSVLYSPDYTPLTSYLHFSVSAMPKTTVLELIFRKFMYLFSGPQAHRSPPISAEVKNGDTIPQLPPYVFMSRCLIKTNFTFTFIYVLISSHYSQYL